VIVAIMGVVLLGEHLSGLGWLAVAVSAAGVLVASIRREDVPAMLGETRMIAAGMASGGLFGLSSTAFRAGIGAMQGGFSCARSPCWSPLWCCKA
jgi:drug/metabolite transporter (DMT)-like permease